MARGGAPCRARRRRGGERRVRAADGRGRLVGLRPGALAGRGRPVRAPERQGDPSPEGRKGACAGVRCGPARGEASRARPRGRGIGTGPPRPRSRLTRDQDPADPVGERCWPAPGTRLGCRVRGWVGLPCLGSGWAVVSEGGLGCRARGRVGLSCPRLGRPVVPGGGWAVTPEGGSGRRARGRGGPSHQGPVGPLCPTPGRPADKEQADPAQPGSARSSPAGPSPARPGPWAGGVFASSTAVQEPAGLPFRRGRDRDA